MPDHTNEAPTSKNRRGRKQKIGTAKSDFTLEDARDLAKALRAQYAAEDAVLRRNARAQGAVLAKGGLSPQRRALEKILKEPGFKEYFGPIDALTLQNQLSLIKKVGVDEDAECPVEHEELEATCPEQRSSNFRECNERADGVQTDTKPEEDA